MEVHSIQTEIIQTAATLIYGLITWGLFELQRYIRTKYKIELNDAAQSELDRVVRDAIAYAEERAHQAVKDGTTIAPNVKLIIATEFAKARAVAAKQAPERLEQMILAALSHERDWRK